MNKKDIVKKILTIRFSHNYQKLQGSGEEIALLQVLRVNISQLSDSFIQYDTWNGIYEFPKAGKFLLLLFLKENGEIFSTLRKDSPGKYEFYLKNTGKQFRIIIGG